jgi:hypothetical protein
MRKEDITPKVIGLAKEICEAGVRFEEFEWAIYNISNESILSKCIEFENNHIHIAYHVPVFSYRELVTTWVRKELCIPIPDFLDCVRWLGEKRIIFDMLDTNDGEYNLMMMEKDPISVQLIRFYDENCQYDALLEGILSCVLEVARREK